MRPFGFALKVAIVLSTVSITWAIDENNMHAAWGEKVDPDFKHASPDAYEAWRDRKFGMRIHWGVYSVLGLDASWPTYKASDEFHRIYNTLWQVFNPTDFDAEQWADLAERSGFKYFVFTAKHCDGFSMYDTNTKVKAFRRAPKTSGHVPGVGEIEECRIHYSIMDGPFKRDITKEVIDAFGKRGMGIGLYYTNSDWFDWDARWESRHQNYDPEYTKESDPEGYARAVARQREQLRELSTKYGPVDQFGFDCGWPKELWPDMVDIIKMVRKLQPNALFRHRGLGPYGDYQTPEHWTPTSGDDTRLNKPWQAIEMLGTRWAYQPNDQYKSKEWILGTLIDCCAKGGNFMVGISPTASGTFPQETIDRLLWVGKWLEVNGEGIYGTRPWEHYKEENTLFTRSKDNKYVYAVSQKWPGNTFRSKLLRAKPESKIYMLGFDSPLKWRQNGNELVIRIPEELQNEKKRPCEFAWVFKVPQDCDN